MRRWLGLGALLLIAVGSTGTAAGIRHFADLNLGVAFCFMAVVGGTVKAWVTDSSKHEELISGALLEMTPGVSAAVPSVSAPPAATGVINAQS